MHFPHTAHERYEQYFLARNQSGGMRKAKGRGVASKEVALNKNTFAPP